MLDRWRELTARGKGFLLAGLLMGTVGWTVGRPDILPAGVLLLVLPPLGLVLAHRSRFRLSAARTVTPTRVPLGSEVTVTIGLTNLSRVPTGLLLLTDDLDPALGVGQRFVVAGITSNDSRVVSYSLAPQARGHRTIGPLRIRVVDTFGLVSLDHSFAAVDRIVVQPRVESLRTTDRTGRWAGGGDAVARAIVAAGADDVVPRDYRVGDELRRVHWRATARTGELMVRREEQPWRTRASLLIDTRATANVGTGIGASFEWLISATASIAIELMHRGYVVEVSDHSGKLIVGPLEPGAAAIAQLLDQLAELELRDDPILPQRRAPDGLCIGLFAPMGPELAAAVARWRSSTGTALALVLDTHSWPESQPRHAHPGHTAPLTLSDLRQCGWNGVVVAPGTSVPQAWSTLVAPSAVRRVQRTNGTGAA
ncbi:MAG: DUF58 domain-containing protein [Actinomycetes bacterium]